MLIGKIKYERYIISWLNDKKLYVKESTYANYSFIVYNYIIPEIGYYNLKLSNINKYIYSNIGVILIITISNINSNIYK